MSKAWDGKPSRQSRIEGDQSVADTAVTSMLGQRLLPSVANSSLLNSQLVLTFVKTLSLETKFSASMHLPQQKPFTKKTELQHSMMVLDWGQNHNQWIHQVFQIVYLKSIEHLKSWPLSLKKTWILSKRSIHRTVQIHQTTDLIEQPNVVSGPHLGGQLKYRLLLSPQYVKQNKKYKKVVSLRCLARHEQR